MKAFIAYFSWSNNTKKIVEEVNKKFNFNVVRIERAIPYSKDYNECAYVEAKDEVSKHIHPEIKNLDIDFGSYDTILLFAPIWWYTVPMPILTFVEGLKGYKDKVVLFANSYTNDPQYMVNSKKDILEVNPDINLTEGLFNKSVKEHINFISEMGDK